MTLNKILLAASVAFILAALSACTDAELATYGAYGESASVKCYSGGDLIHDDVSTGKVIQIDGDGITYKSKNTGQYVRAYADCIVTTL